MPKQERAQEQLAERRLLGHDRPRLGRRDAKHPPGSARDRCEKGSLTGQEADLAQKSAWPIGGDEGLSRLAGVRHDLDLALEHDDEVVCLVTLGKQDVPRRGRLLTPVRAQHSKLCSVEHR